jgi:hypothetical protein
MLRLFASRIRDFQHLLAKPKSVPPTILTTFGEIEPLGFERFRICELYAELLHCSNMVLLNDERGEEVVRERDIEREKLRKQVTSNVKNVDIWGDTTLRNGAHPTLSRESSDESDEEEPKSVVGHSAASPEPHPGGDDSENEKGSEGDGPPGQLELMPQRDVRERSGLVTPAESFPTATGDATLSATVEHATTVQSLDSSSLNDDNHRGLGGDESDEVIVSSGIQNRPVVGDYLKMQFVESRVLPSVVDLFFAHPWNNFLHNVVYDILTQVLNGPMDKGFNRQLAIDLFTTGQLTEKIIEGQRISDEAQ